MDNITHTLVGLALGEAGLRRRTALATVTLIIGANLPDADGLAYLVGSGTDALMVRRGWTHGILAMVVLPLLLTGVVLGCHRILRGRGEPHSPEVHPWWILVLASVSIWSHPLLDLLNTYGVRLLMPFSGRWFYGDALFIVDPWLWLVLGVGIGWSRRENRMRPARAALAVSLAYASAMALGSEVGGLLVERQAQGPPALRVLLSPEPLTPFRRQVIRDLGTEYERGILTWGRRPAYAVTSREPVGRDDPDSQAASRTPDGRAFLAWARFPGFTTERQGDSVRVTISDLRYARDSGRSWASVRITVPTSAR